MRDTWEITPDLVTLDGPAWEATLGAVLDGVRDELGLPPTTKLRAELHAMLVYDKGQFFLPHQDSEKDDAGRHAGRVAAFGAHGMAQSLRTVQILRPRTARCSP